VAWPRSHCAVSKCGCKHPERNAPAGENGGRAYPRLAVLHQFRLALADPGAAHDRGRSLGMAGIRRRVTQCPGDQSAMLGRCHRGLSIIERALGSEGLSAFVTAERDPFRRG
jgi:hypothetical protein